MSNLTLDAGVFSQPQPCKEGSFCEWATSDNTFAVVGDVSSNPMLPMPAGELLPKGYVYPHTCAPWLLRTRRGQRAGGAVLARFVHPLRRFRGLPLVSRRL